MSGGPAGRCPVGSFGLLHGRQGIEQFFQILRRIDAELPAGFDKAVDHGTGLSGVRTAEEQEVLFSKVGWTNGVFNEILIDFD